MSDNTNMIFDFQIPAGFISAIAQENNYQVNSLGCRWYNSIDSPDLSHEIEDMLHQMKPEDTILLFQTISSLVSPVFIWDCLMIRPPLQTIQFSAFFPDYDDIIPPLLIWKDTEGDMIKIKRIIDRNALITMLDDITMPEPVILKEDKRMNLPIDAFLYLLRISDCFHLIWLQALENHAHFRDYIQIDTINNFNSDALYLHDKRWSFPAGKAICSDYPDEWDEERKNQALSHLINSGFIVKDESGEDISLSDDGMDFVSYLSPYTAKIASRESSLHTESQVTTSAHWMIKNRGKMMVVFFGEIPSQEIVITITDTTVIKSYHQELICLNETGRNLPVIPGTVE